MSRIIVTGGAGFIGSHLVDALIERGDEVLVIDNLSTGKIENLNPKAEFHQIDLRDLESIKPLFKGVDFVFHQAAFTRISRSIEEPLESNETNINGTLNTLLCAKELGVKKFIYASSSSVYGNQKELPLREDMRPNPLNPYALQKYTGELYCKIFQEIYGLKTVSLRYFNVYGPRLAMEGSYVSAISVFLKQRKRGELLTITGDGSQSRDFSFVSDVVRANILAMESEKVGRGEVINIGAGRSFSINDLARLIGGQTITLPSRPGEVKDTLADISKAKKLLGWQPQYNLETGLKEMMKKKKINEA